MTGIVRHLPEEVRRNRRDNRDHDERRGEIGRAQFADVTHQHGGFHRERADRDAGGNRQLLVDADQRGGAAHLRRLDLGIGDGVDRGELQRAEEAADHQDDHDQQQRRRHREQRAGGKKDRTDDGVDGHEIAEAEGPDDARPPASSCPWRRPPRQTSPARSGTATGRTRSASTAAAGTAARRCRAGTGSRR